MLEGIRSLIIEGWDPAGLALAFGFAIGLAVVGLLGLCRAAHEQVDADMRHSSFVSVALGVAWRTLHNVFTTPSLLLPRSAVPAAELHGLRGRPLGADRGAGVRLRAAGTRRSSSSFVLSQSAAFGGVFTAFGIARDFEFGFAKRLLARGAAAHRAARRATRSPRSVRWAVHGRWSSPSWRCSQGCRSAAAASTSSGSTRSPLLVQHRRR